MPAPQIWASSGCYLYHLKHQLGHGRLYSSVSKTYTEGVGRCDSYMTVDRLQTQAAIDRCTKCTHIQPTCTRNLPINPKSVAAVASAKSARVY